MQNAIIATILSALYFAKQFGINNSLDISPLFETSNSIERGARILEQVLDCNPFIKNIQNRKKFVYKLVSQMLEDLWGDNFILSS